MYVMSSLLGKVVVESRRAIDEIFYSWHKTEVVEGGGYGKKRRIKDSAGKEWSYRSGGRWKYVEEDRLEHWQSKVITEDCGVVWCGETDCNCSMLIKNHFNTKNIRLYIMTSILLHSTGTLNNSHGLQIEAPRNLFYKFSNSSSQISSACLLEIGAYQFVIL